MRQFVLGVILLPLLLAACGGSSSPAPTATPVATDTPAPTASPDSTATSTSTPARPTSTTETTPTVETTATVEATATPVPSGASGVQGIVLIGPMCPVQRVDTPCPDRPWEGVVVAQDQAGQEVARTTTDSAGRFAMTLSPGQYVLVTLTTGVLPAPVSLPVTVPQDAFTEVQLSLDSGIR